MEIIKTRVRQALSRSGLGDVDYALNPYLGCWHACIYCYARLYTPHPKASRMWGEVVVVKENIVEVLEREASRLPRGVVGLGTITDPYQPVEAVYKLTQKSLRILLERGFPVSIQTKNTLILRDIGLLEDYKRLVDVGVTITSLDWRKARVWEPRAPHPRERAKIVYEASSRGIETWIFYGPIIPGYNDDPKTIEEIVKLDKEAKATLYYDRLHIKSFMRKNPFLAKTIKQTEKYNWRKLYRNIREVCSKLKVACREGFYTKNKEPLAKRREERSLLYYFNQP